MRDAGAMVPRPEAFLLPIAGDTRFCLFHPAANPARIAGAFVYVHPFAEEMNKSRRMAALQSRALAGAGFAVLQIDLHGCGDSAGDFADATWSGWVGDVIAAALWLRAKTGCVPSLWGLRAGCLLAAEAAAQMDALAGLLFWQPVVLGSLHLQQFLRLRVAGRLVGRASDDRMGTAELRAELARGVSVDVAGYTLSPGLASGMEAASMAPIPGKTRVAWLEVAGSDPAEVAPASSIRIDAWRAAGHDVVAQAVSGLAFWQTQEIAECAGLVSATHDAVLRHHR